jgi:pyruvate dehydrogenase E2 component (dihydrolipoamide acetyltransferase)
MAGITPIVMPKWGLSMKEGTVMAWLVEEGAQIRVGQEILEVETDKIANAVEAPDAGRLRRRLAAEGEKLPVKALLGVMADDEVDEATLDAYIAGYVTPTPEDEDEADVAPAYQWAEVDGLRIRYARRGGGDGGGVAGGDRTPALFIHGFDGDLDNWLFNLDAVAEHRPVIALDLPGHGQSTPRLPGASVAALADFVARFLDTLGVGRVHAVGHSMGGAIASQLAMAHGDRVSSVSLIGSAGFGEQVNSAYTEGFATATSRRELKPVLEQLFADPSLVSRQMVDDVLRYKRLDGVEPLLLELSQALFGGGRQAELPGRGLALAAKPVLVVWGHEDRIIPVAHADQAPTGATVERFEGAGHMVQMEKASEVNRLLVQRMKD